MAHTDRKTRKMRGSRNCGYGNTQKHRGKGSRGGVGMAGSKKHKWSYVSKYMPDHFGHKGFKRPAESVHEDSTINVGYIDQHLEAWVEKGLAKPEAGKYVVDLTSLYDKLLGSGKVTHAIIISVGKCSGSAKKKVEEAGGRVECASEEVEGEAALK